MRKCLDSIRLRGGLLTFLVMTGGCTIIAGLDNIYILDSSNDAGMGGTGGTQTSATTGEPTGAGGMGGIQTTVTTGGPAGSGGDTLNCAVDPPDDMNNCTEDSCDNGMPVYMNLPAGSPCGPAALCDGAGMCYSCGDGMQNGVESDVDCGGGCPSKCKDGAGCKVGEDCTSGVCSASTCQVPTCTDNVKNGGEIGTDCGGQCLKCNGVMCSSPSPGGCASGYCIDGWCCNAICDKVCELCNLSGSVGTCVPNPKYLDDFNCKGNMTCDGSGLCRNDAGVPCIDHSECASGNCVNGVCKKKTGESCIVGSECESGVCTQNKCT